MPLATLGGMAGLRLVVSLLWLSACARPPDGPGDAAVLFDSALSSDAGDSGATGNAGSECDGPSALLDLAEQLVSGPEPCRRWVDAVRGRVLVNGPASAVIWTTRTPGETNLAVMVSAVHVLGSGWFNERGAGVGADVPELLAAPAADTWSVMRVRVPTPSGELDRAYLSPQWITYRPAIPADEHEDVTTILPRHDLFVGLVDGQDARVKVIETVIEYLERALESHGFEIPPETPGS